MHKELYFTPDTIQVKARDLLASLEVKQTPLQFHPEKAALLVLDMQEYFLSVDSHAFVPSAPAALPGIVALVDVFAALHYPVFFTRHLNTIENAGMMSVWWRDLIRPQTARSHIIHSLNASPGTIIVKSQYDAFFHTELENLLRKSNIMQVVIAGVLTHLCCETTARSAFMRGFEVFFTVDGTATYNEDLHRASLLTLAHGFAVPVLVDEIRQAISG